MEISLEDKLLRMQKCSVIRNIAAQTCLYTFQQVFNYPRKVSEQQFKTRWSKELQKSYSKGFIGCWYDPPPEGIAVLFAQEKKPERINYSTLRPENYWPNPKIYLDKEGLGYIFTSPFTFVGDVPIIGDFGFTYYLGKNLKIIDYFKRVKDIMDNICDLVSVGMTYGEIYKKINDLIKRYDMVNNVYSITNKSLTNLGHSIPFIDRNPTDKERDIFISGNKDLINKAINLARIFINKTEENVIGENSAFTIEPRLTSSKDKSMPMCSFHTIVQFVEGEKIILTNFKGICNLLKMDWLNY